MKFLHLPWIITGSIHAFFMKSGNDELFGFCLTIPIYDKYSGFG